MFWYEATGIAKGQWRVEQHYTTCAAAYNVSGTFPSNADLGSRPLEAIGKAWWRVHSSLWLLARRCFRRMGFIPDKSGRDHEAMWSVNTRTTSAKGELSVCLGGISRSGAHGEAVNGDASDAGESVADCLEVEAASETRSDVSLVPDIDVAAVQAASAEDVIDAANLSKWHALIRFFNDSEDIHGAMYVSIGDERLRSWCPQAYPPGTVQPGSDWPRLAVGLTKKGSIVGLFAAVNVA